MRPYHPRFSKIDLCAVTRSGCNVHARRYSLGTAYFATMRLTQGRKRFETIDRAIRQIRTREDFNRNLVLSVHMDRSLIFFFSFFSEDTRSWTSHLEGEKESYIVTCIMKYINLTSIYLWFISYIYHKWRRMDKCYFRFRKSGLDNGSAQLWLPW